MASAAVLMLVAGILVYFGNALVERVLSIWAIFLYVLYGGLVVWCVTHYGDAIESNLATAQDGFSWLAGGIAYAGYNLAAVPGVLFTMRHATCRRDAMIAGSIGGLLGALPGILLYLCVVAFYPEITHQAVPSVYILARIGSPHVTVIFQVALFVTLVKTGVGLLHGLNERIAAACVDRRCRCRYSCVQPPRSA